MKGLIYLLQRDDFNIALKNFKDACSFSQNNFHFHNHLAICYKIIYNLQKTKSQNLLDLSEKDEESSKNSKNENNSRSNNSSEIESSDYEKEKLQRKKGKEIKESSKASTNGTKLRNKYKYCIIR